MNQPNPTRRARPLAGHFERHGAAGSVAGLLLSALLGACATVPPGSETPKDPLQSFNRSIYKFNDTLDRAVLKPVAQGYRFVTPHFVRTGVRNFFSNLDDVTVSVNDVLQGKVSQGGHDALRVVLNTTLGVLGFVDVATGAGFEKHNEDFGQTLGAWGVGSGPYLVLPLLGPSTVRDTFGRVGDLPTSPYVRFSHVSVAHRNEVYVLDAVRQRESLLDTEDVLDEATLGGDRYNFVRDAFLQRRRNLVYDGSPPPDPDEQLDDDPGAGAPAPGTAAGAPAAPAQATPAADPAAPSGKEAPDPATPPAKAVPDPVAPAGTALLEVARPEIVAQASTAADMAVPDTVATGGTEPDDASASASAVAPAPEPVAGDGATEDAAMPDSAMPESATQDATAQDAAPADDKQQ